MGRTGVNAIDGSIDSGGEDSYVLDIRSFGVLEGGTHGALLERGKLRSEMSLP